MMRQDYLAYCLMPFTIVTSTISSKAKHGGNGNYDSSKAIFY
jgi:hypothetical protein